MVGKGENAGYRHFLVFLPCFIPFTKQSTTIQLHLFCRLHILSILNIVEKQKLLVTTRKNQGLFGKGLKKILHLNKKDIFVLSFITPY